MFAQLYWQNQRNVCCASSRDPSVEQVCGFHGASLTFNLSFSVGTLNIFTCLCQMECWSAEFWPPFCGIPLLLNGAQTSLLLLLTWLFSRFALFCIPADLAIS